MMLTETSDSGGSDSRLTPPPPLLPNRCQMLRVIFVEWVTALPVWFQQLHQALSPHRDVVTSCFLKKAEERPRSRVNPTDCSSTFTILSLVLQLCGWNHPVCSFTRLRRLFYSVLLFVPYLKRAVFAGSSLRLGVSRPHDGDEEGMGSLTSAFESYFCDFLSVKGRFPTPPPPTSLQTVEVKVHILCCH